MNRAGWSSAGAGDVLCEVLVALEPVVEVTRDDVRGLREVADRPTRTIHGDVELAGDVRVG